MNMMEGYIVVMQEIALYLHQLKSESSLLPYCVVHVSSCFESGFFPHRLLSSTRSFRLKHFWVLSSWNHTLLSPVKSVSKVLSQTQWSRRRCVINFCCHCKTKKSTEATWETRTKTDSLTCKTNVSALHFVGIKIGSTVSEQETPTLLVNPHLRVKTLITFSQENISLGSSFQEQRQSLSQTHRQHKTRQVV